MTFRITRNELSSLQARLAPHVSAKTKQALATTPMAPVSATSLPSEKVDQAVVERLAAIDQVFDITLAQTMSGDKTEQLADILRAQGPFADYAEADVDTLRARAPWLKEMQTRTLQYRDRLGTLADKSKKNNEWDINAIRAFQKEFAKVDDDGMPLLPTKDRIAILQVYHDMGAWQDVVDAWYELSAIQPSAAQDEIALESLVVAMQKLGEKTAKGAGAGKPNELLPKALETATGIARRAIPEGEINYEAVRGNRFINAEVLAAGLGKTYRLVAGRLGFAQQAAALDRGKTKAVIEAINATNPGALTKALVSEGVEVPAGLFKAIGMALEKPAWNDKVEDITKALKRAKIKLDDAVKNAAFWPAVMNKDPDIAATIEPEMQVYRRFLDMEQSDAAEDCSFRYYLAAFGRDHHYYPGWNAYFESFKKGDVEETERLSPLVWEALERDGGANASDFWALATYVQLAAIENQNDALMSAMRRFLNKATDYWKVASTYDTVEVLDHPVAQKLAAILEARRAELNTDGTEVPADKNWVEKSVAAMEEVTGVKEPKEATDAASQYRRDVTEWLTKNTTSLEKLANSDMVGGSYVGDAQEVTGNSKFGGQIVDTEINRFTRRVMLGVLEDHLAVLPKNETARDFWTTLKNIQQFVRKALNLVDESGRPTVERLNSPDHHTLDGVNQGQIELSQAPRKGDTSTNLALILAGGFGDCRPTEKLVDYGLILALTELKNHYRHQIYHAKSDTEKQELMDKIAELSRFEIAGASVRIWGTMLANDLYDYLDAESNLPIWDGKYNGAENHDMPLYWEKSPDGLVKCDERGPIVYAIDGFYQDEVYHFAKKRLYVTEMELPSLDRNKEGQLEKRFVLDAGEMGLVSKTGETIHNVIDFTKYSGTGIVSRWGSHAGASFLGLNGPDITPEDALQRIFEPLNRAIAEDYWKNRPADEAH